MPPSKPPGPLLPPASAPRAPAEHVQAALVQCKVRDRAPSPSRPKPVINARPAQCKVPEPPSQSRQPAAHVQAAIASVQQKTGPVQKSRPPAPHVRAALSGGGKQPKMVRPAVLPGAPPPGSLPKTLAAAPYKLGIYGRGVVQRADTKHIPDNKGVPGEFKLQDLPVREMASIAERWLPLLADDMKRLTADAKDAKAQDHPLFVANEVLTSMTLAPDQADDSFHASSVVQDGTTEGLFLWIDRGDHLAISMLTASPGYIRHPRKRPGSKGVGATLIEPLKKIANSRDIGISVSAQGQKAVDTYASQGFFKVQGQAHDMWLPSPTLRGLITATPHLRDRLIRMEFNYHVNAIPAVRQILARAADQDLASAGLGETAPAA